jgi:D-alanine-D-alanine ligase
LDLNGTPRLLEVNPNPGWCWDGHLAKMANIAGMTYAQMLHDILKASERRITGASAGQRETGTESMSVSQKELSH